MKLCVYNPVSLELLAVVTKATSIIWEKKHYDVGNFELHLPRDAPYIETLTSGNIVVQGGNYGVIRYVSAPQERGANDVEIRGQTLQGICSDRTIVPPFFYMEGEIDPLYSYDRIKGTGEAVMKHYVTNHLTAPEDADRKIDNLIVAEDLGRGKTEVAWQAKFEKLSDVLKEIGQYAGLGWDITLDPVAKQYQFDVIEGIDRTVTQSDVAPVQFCREMKNVTSLSYENDGLSAINTVYAAGDGEEEQQYVTKLGGGTGISRREGTTSVSSDDVEEVRDLATAYLEENSVKESIEAVANDKTVYGQDWNLGDYVTVRVETPGEILMLNKQITEVCETWERGIHTIEPVFGEKKDDIIKRMKRGKDNRGKRLIF